MTSQIDNHELLYKTNGNWYLVAKLITLTISTNRWKPGQTALSEWMSSASKVTGFSLNTLGRMISVYEFINQIAPPKAIEDNPGSYPFSSLEILKRIHVIEPSRTSILLAKINNKEISMRDLRKELESLQSEQPKGDTNRRFTFMRKSSEFKKLALTRIEKSLSEFNFTEDCVYAVFSKKKLDREDNGFIPTPDAFAFNPDSINKSITGFDITYIGHEKNQLMHIKPNLILKCCYMSSFYSKMYLVLPDTVDLKSAQNIADTFFCTKRFNIGVVLLKSAESQDIGSNFVFLYQPSDKATPTPDCRALVGWDSLWDKKNNHFSGSECKRIS